MTTWRIFSAILFWAIVSQAAEQPSCAQKKENVEAAFELGLALTSVLPTRLPDFDNPQSAYGLIAALPFGAHAITAEAYYGASEYLSLQLGELAYRWSVPSPHLKGYVLFGGHYLHYSKSGKNHHFGGPFSGVGFTFSMASKFEASLGMKMYYHGNPMLSFGGGFRFLL